MATTASRDPAQYRVARNAAVHRFVPHRMVLSRATCVIGTATMGLTQKALLAGGTGVRGADRPRPMGTGRPRRGLRRRVQLPAQRLNPGRLRLAA